MFFHAFFSCVSFLQTHRRHDSHTICTGESSEIFSSQPNLLIVLFENLADGQIKKRKKKKQPPDGKRLGFSALPEHPLRIMLALRQDQHPAGVA